jgi:uncharacterized protein (DUF736 family)
MACSQTGQSIRSRQTDQANDPSNRITAKIKTTHIGASLRQHTHNIGNHYKNCPVSASRIDTLT